jgi:hypothetical protein
MCVPLVQFGIVMRNATYTWILGITTENKLVQDLERGEGEMMPF